MLRQATMNIDNKDGVYIHFCTDNSLFNLRQLQHPSKMTEQLVRELLFIDDAVLIRLAERAQ